VGTVATKNVTISQALVALFNLHNVQTCWLRGLSGTYVFADENGSFPQLESFGVFFFQNRAPSIDSHSGRFTWTVAITETH